MSYSGDLGQTGIRVKIAGVRVLQGEGIISRADAR